MNWSQTIPRTRQSFTTVVGQRMWKLLAVPLHSTFLMTTIVDAWLVRKVSWPSALYSHLSIACHFSTLWAQTYSKRFWTQEGLLKERTSWFVALSSLHKFVYSFELTQVFGFVFSTAYTFDVSLYLAIWPCCTLRPYSLFGDRWTLRFIHCLNWQR